LSVADTFTVPGETPVAFPLLITDTEGFEELQFAWPVRPSTDPSLNVPEAMNCCEAFTEIDALPGVTAIEFRVAFVTVRAAVPTCPAKTAEIIVLPGCTPVADPAVLCALLMVAIDDFEDVQVTKPVRSCLSPLLNVPVALNWVRMVIGTCAFAGETCIEVSAADSTRIFAVPLIDPCRAVTVTTPPDCPVTKPVVFKVAMLLSDVDHATDGLILTVLPSLKVPVAVSCTPDAGARSAEEGVIAIETRVAEVTVIGAMPVLLTPP